MFLHSPLDFPNLPDESTPSGRFYTTPEGEKYPSVTTVLSATDDGKALDAWRNRIGHAEAAKITQQAANRGTQIHKIFEDYLGNCLDIDSYNPIQWQKFRQSQKTLDEHVDLVYNIEFPVYSDRLKIAGRCDLLCKWDGINSVVDHKTSNKPKREEWIQKYFIQKTLYAMMVFEITGLKVPQIVTHISVESETYPQIFVKRTEDYIPLALKTVRSYYANRNATASVH